MAGEIFLPNQKDLIKVSDGEEVPIYLESGYKHIIWADPNYLKYVRNCPPDMRRSSVSPSQIEELCINSKIRRQAVLEGNIVVRVTKSE